jgi:spore coat protein U-like protein
VNVAVAGNLIWKRLCIRSQKFINYRLYTPVPVSIFWSMIQTSQHQSIKEHHSPRKTYPQCQHPPLFPATRKQNREKYR